MKRTAVAAAWILGSTVPLLAAAVFLIGCCIGPFHGVIHRLMPFCQTAAAMVSGHAGHDHDDPPATPAKAKDEPVKRVVGERTETFQLAVALVAPRIPLRTAGDPDRNFLSLGATRCDQDVGLNVLVRTFRI